MSRKAQSTSRLAALCVVGALAVGCSPAKENVEVKAAPSSEPSASAAAKDEQEQTSDEIRSLLVRRMQAVNQGRRSAFLRTIDRSEKKFAAKQRTLFKNLSALPIVHFEYRPPQDEGFRASGFSGNRVAAQIIEDVQLKGSDQYPVSNVLPMAFVRKDGKWLVTEGYDPRYNGGDIQSRPWSGGPIAVARDGKTLVVVDKEREGDLDSLVSSVEREIPSIAETLGLKPRYDLLVDATSSGRRTRFGGKSKEAASAVAFNVYRLDGPAQRPVRLAGQRIKLDPQRVDELIGRRVLLRHELSHFLTKGTTDAPPWIEEGLAEYVSYYPARPSGLVVTGGVLERVLDQPRAMPSSKRFGEDASADYLIAHAGTTYLIDTFGMKKFTRFRLSYESSSAEPDTQTRKRLRKTYGISKSEFLDRTWSTIGEFHSG